MSAGKMVDHRKCLGQRRAALRAAFAKCRQRFALRTDLDAIDRMWPHNTAADPILECGTVECRAEAKRLWIETGRQPRSVQRIIDATQKTATEANRRQRQPTLPPFDGRVAIHPIGAFDTDQADVWNELRILLGQDDDAMFANIECRCSDLPSWLAVRLDRKDDRSRCERVAGLFASLWQLARAGVNFQSLPQRTAELLGCQLRFQQVRTGPTPPGGNGGAGGRCRWTTQELESRRGPP